MELLNKIKDALQGKVPKGNTRSPLWPRVRAEHLKKFPSCMVCGKTKKLQVHHKMPFHKDPSMELNPLNLVTLCEHGSNCHLVFGHAGNFRGMNPDIDQDIVAWKTKFIRSSTLAQKEKK